MYKIYSFNEYIKQLDEFAAQNFPVKEVTEFLNSSRLPFDSIMPKLFFLPRRYTRHLVKRTSKYELVYLCWGPGQQSPVHGHAGEKCWFRVEQGTLLIKNYENQNGKLVMTSQMNVGEGFVDGPAEIHGVQNASNQNTISLHLYAHPIDECEVYDLNKNEVQIKKLFYDSILK